MEINKMPKLIKFELTLVGYDVDTNEPINDYNLHPVMVETAFFVSQETLKQSVMGVNLLLKYQLGEKLERLIDDYIKAVGKESLTG